MTLGRHTVTFTANSPIHPELSSSCTLTIHIKDSEPPRVVSCPSSRLETLARGQMLKKISWPEPEFRDNVAIQHVMASYLPGHYFPEGRHHVLYQAVDGDGNPARCGFTITVKREEFTKTRPRGQPHYGKSESISFNRADSVLHLAPPRLSHSNSSSSRGNRPFSYISATVQAEQKKTFNVS